MSKIIGDLTILTNGKIFVGERLMCNDDSINLKIKTLKQIIKDSKEGMI